MSNKEEWITCDHKSIFCTFKYGSSIVVKMSRIEAGKNQNIPDIMSDGNISVISWPLQVHWIFGTLFRWQYSWLLRNQQSPKKPQMKSLNFQFSFQGNISWTWITRFMVKFCFRYEIYGYEIYGRRYEIYGSLRDLWEGLRDLWEFARFMGVTRFMGRTPYDIYLHTRLKPWRFFSRRHA